MATLGLLFVGAVLFVNGVSLLGAFTPKAAATLNLLVGSSLVIVAGWEVFPLRDFTVTANLNIVIGAVGFVLFGFTYMWLGLLGFTGHPGGGLGWYCGWAAIIATFLAVTSYTRLDDPRFGMLWVLWAVLFLLFFLVLGLGKTELATATGWIVVISSFVTATIPGGLLLVGEWGNVPETVITLIGLACIVGYVPLLMRGRMAAAPAPA
jgi:hypothetical protein